MESADVFLTNFRPQARTKLKIDLEDIRAVNPDIIYVRGSANGQRGPESKRGGYDNSTFWGRGGSADILSAPGEYPTSQPGPGYGDVIGGLTIAGGVSAALFHRQRTGEAVTVDNSLLANGIWATGATVLAADLFGFSRMPRGDRTKMPNPLVNNYKTKDDRFLSLIMLESDRFWADLVIKIGRPELADDPRFVDSVVRAQNRQECVITLDEIFAGRTLDEWKPILFEVEGVWAPVQTASELLEDPRSSPTTTSARSPRRRGRPSTWWRHRCSSMSNRRTSPGHPTTGNTPTRSSRSWAWTWTPFSISNSKGRCSDQVSGDASQFVFPTRSAPGPRPGWRDRSRCW